MSADVLSLIHSTAAKYNLDPDAWAAIIFHESGLDPNSVGDGGTSMGLTQLHIHGALGNISRDEARKYLDPQLNLDTAGKQMAAMGLGGLRGAKAIDAYSRRFERPSNPAGEIADAMNWYKKHAGEAGSAPAQTSPGLPMTGQANSLQSQQNGLLTTLMANTTPQNNGLQGVNQQTMDLINAFGNGGLHPTGAPAARPLGQGVASDVMSGPISASAPKVIQMAKQYMGTKYVWGGTTPAGFDCSGFVQYLYGKQGIKLPRTTYEQIKVGQHIDRKGLQPGDIVFFSANGDVHHEGLYIGNNQFIHAPHTGDVVKISSLNDAYYAKQFAGGRRV